jgi:hypothetical protein
MPIGIESTPKTYKSWANGYKTLIETSFKKMKDYRSGIFYKEKTENWEDRLVEIGGVDEYERWDDGVRASQTEIVEGYDTKIIQVPFGKELPIGRLMKQFQGFDVNITKRAARELGKRAYRLQQKAAFSLIDYAHSTTNTYLTNVTGATVSALTPDGVRLASTLHVCSPTNSTTFSNVLSDSKSVSEEALEDMVVNLNDQLDDKGLPMHLGDDGYIWVVPLNEFFEAQRIVGSELRSNTADNDTNVFYGSFDGRPIEVRWVPWLSETSTDAHVLVARDSVEDLMPMCVYESTPFYTDDYIEDSTDTAFVRGRATFGVKASTGRGLCFSLGDDSTTVTY